MQVKLSWANTVSVWWSLYWRWTAYSVVFAVGVGIVSVPRVPGPEHAWLYVVSGGFLGSLRASLLAVRGAVSRHLPSMAALAGR